MNQEEQANALSQLIAKCWADEDFKQKLLADPMATLKANAIEVPAGLTIQAVENTETLFHLVIPARPTELSDDELDQIAGGTWWDALLRAGKSALPIAARIGMLS